jgi:8-amino-7-oxononanoate synthase
MATSMLSNWIKSQKLQAGFMKTAPTFYRNLEEALDIRRGDHALYTIKENLWKDGHTVDFCSNDILSLGTSGVLRKEFMQEIDLHKDLSPGSGGSRMMCGNYEYLDMVEEEIARFHGAEAGLIVSSGFEANIAIFAAIPRPGDVILYDELVHASTHDGMQQSLATCKIQFSHNDIDSLRDALTSVWDSQPLIREGKRSVLIAVESIYSMEGDVCPLEEMLEVAREIFPEEIGNCQFIVDEAHSTGIIGPAGAGIVAQLGLENQIAIRLHTFGKALASTGGMSRRRPTLQFTSHSLDSCYTR